MKKILIASILTLVLAVSLVAAFWPFTGNAIGDKLLPGDNCEDSDEGIEEDTAGYVTYKATFGESTRVDKCSGNKVIERYCDNNDKPKRVARACPAGCEYVETDMGEAGQCIQEESPQGGGIIGYCNDTDGPNALVAGYAVKPLEAGRDLFVDTCVDDFNIEESICSENRVLSTRIRCSGDAAGKCEAKNITIGSQQYVSAKCTPQPESCADTDKDRKYNERGVVTTINAQGKQNTFYDFCLPNGKLFDFYCNVNVSASNVTQCPSGKVCSAGACMAAKCSDDDNGKVYGLAGTTSTEYGSFNDVCIDRNKLLEGSCKSAYSTEILVESKTCTNGCSAGACNSTATS